MKLNVPYYSQFIDVQDSFWMLRACGAIAFKEVVEFYGKEVSDVVSLCNEAKESGGYDMNNGWVHDYLVTQAKALGFDAYRKEGLDGIDEVIAHLEKGNPVVVSVEKRVLEQKRFHIIVLTGFEFEGDLKHITKLYYHESESTDIERGRHRMCDVDTFKNYWRGKAIFISPSVM